MVHRNFELEQETHPERLWTLTRLGDAKVVYDMGCGAHKTVSYAIGVDIRPVSDITASVDDVPVADEVADIIISRHSLEHMLDPIKTLQEWRRILRRRGRILIILPDHGSIDTMLPEYGNGEHLHAYTMESFATLISLFDGLEFMEIGAVLEDWSFGAVLKKVEKE